MKYISIDRIFSKVYRELKNLDIEENDIIEWTGEALEFMRTPRSFTEAVAFREVKNYTCPLPSKFHAIIQVLNNVKYKPGYDTLCPEKIVSDLPTKQDSGPDIPVALDCNGMPLSEYEVAYYRPYFDLIYDYVGFQEYAGNNGYVPVTLSQNNFFDSLVCTQNEQFPIYKNTGYEYKLIDDDFLKFSFESGYVAISFLRQRVSDNGYPQIPDSISHITAIVKYITMRKMESQFYEGRSGASTKLAKAEDDWDWYCGQAINSEKMLRGIDEYENFTKNRKYMLPPSSYYGYFGKINNNPKSLYGGRQNQK